MKKITKLTAAQESRLVDFLERMAIIRGFIDPTTETSSERQP